MTKLRTLPCDAYFGVLGGAPGSEDTTNQGSGEHGHAQDNYRITTTQAAWMVVRVVGGGGCGEGSWVVAGSRP